jgi:hypothetical protein
MAQSRPPIGTVEEVKPDMGKYRFKYDWFKNPTIYGVDAGSGSNDIFTFSKGDVVNAVGIGRMWASDAYVPDNRFIKVENVKYDPLKNSSSTTGISSYFENYLSNLNNPISIQVPINVLEKIDDSTPVTLQTGVNFGQNPQPVVGSSVIVENPIDVVPVEVKPYVKPKPYLVVRDFIIYSRWENRMGQSGVQELPYSKGGVIFLPTATHQDQYEIALKDGKLQELPIVSVVSLVDKQMGKCISDGALYQTMEYNPCRTVKKGETLIGYIANGVFTNTNQDVMKPQLYVGEYELIQTNSGTVVTAKNHNKNLLMIVGAFLVGYLIFSKGKSE